MTTNSKFRILLFLIVPLLVNCSSLAPRPKSDSFYTDFLNGDTRLECKVTCAFTFGTAIPDLMQLYNAGLWKDLAQKVYTIGLNQDISYFFLGRAAEELNKPIAAETYYKLAKSASSCMLNGCAGFKFPEVIEHRLLVLKTTQEKMNSYDSNKAKSNLTNTDFKIVESSEKKCINLGFEIGSEKFKTCVEKASK